MLPDSIFFLCPDPKNSITLKANLSLSLKIQACCIHLSLMLRIAFDPDNFDTDKNKAKNCIVGRLFLVPNLFRQKKGPGIPCLYIADILKSLIVRGTYMMRSQLNIHNVTSCVC